MLLDAFVKNCGVTVQKLDATLQIVGATVPQHKI